MKKKRVFSLLLALACVLSLLTGCGSKGNADNGSDNSDHPTITMNAPYRNMSTFYNLVKEKYPEINLEIEPYNGNNTTSYFNDMRKTGNMPDIYFSTIYFPGRYDDAADFLDLSGYDFTGNYAQSRLREVTNNGGVYMLPLGYNALGITYNKTLLEEHGWTLPTNLDEFAALKEKCEEAGVIFCRNQLELPGYGFQYLCNILDTGFLSTVDGMNWQNKYITGEATVSGTPEMMEAMQLLQKWRDLGILNADGTPNNDTETRDHMVEGNTLFLIGNSNDLNVREGAVGTYRLMPYLSESGNQNVFILNVSRYVGLNKNLGEKGNEKKLADVLKIMDLLSTVEGMESLDPNQNNSRILPLKDFSLSEDNYYYDIQEELNSGHAASFIYAGWENIIVPLGEKMIEFVKGEATLDEVVAFMDENQHLLTDNDVTYYTTVTETLSTEDCAKAIGISFAEATGSEAALVSTNPWTINEDVQEMNKYGVSGRLFAVGISDEQIVEILPTSWNNTIQTVTLSGKRIKELAETGFDFYNDGSVMFPYVLVTKGGMELDDNTTYTIPICGVSDAVKEEGNWTETDIVGLEATEKWFGQFETLSAKDIVWE